MPAAEDGVSARDADLRLAGLHLRLGALTLARAELEAADAESPLSGGPLLDLAEVRWRTGDMAGGGAAAEAFLESAGPPPSILATVIAVEAALADGRPSDARQRREALSDVQAEALDAVFAGMPRSGAWPEEAGVAQPSSAGRPPASPIRPGGHVPSAPGGPTGAAASGGAPISAVAELDAARADLETGLDEDAAIRLAVVLRLAPQLAPAVLDLLEGSAGPMSDLVRGDAYRLVGRGTEAERAWRAAADQLAAERAARERRAAGSSRTAPYASTAAGAASAGVMQPPAAPLQAISGAEAPDREPESEETP